MTYLNKTVRMGKKGEDKVVREEVRMPSRLLKF